MSWPTTAARAVSAPANFPWPFYKWPVTIFGSNGRFSTDVNPRRLVDQRIWSSSTYIHVNFATGNDSTAAVVATPSDTTKAAATIGKAIQLGNAAATPYRVLVYTGTASRQQSIGSFAGGVYPTQPMSLEAWGGRVIHGIWQTGIGWTLDTGATYTQSRASILRVFDILNTNKWGDYVELTLAASQAACESTAGTWFQAAGQSPLYVHRADGAVVTDANTRCYLGALPNFQLPLAAAGDGMDCYVSGFDFEGGYTGCIYNGSNVARNFVAVDCTFKYSGSFASPIDCVQIVNMVGLAAFFNSGCSASTKDGFNFHYNRTDIPVGLFALTVDCWGRDCGRAASTSNNGHTGHETCIAIDVNGVYDSNYGGNVHWIGQSNIWCVGTVSQNSLGDIVNGGSVLSTGFRTNDSAVMWLDNTKSLGNLYAVDAHDFTAQIYLRGHRSSGGMETASVATGATIGVY